MKKLWESKYRKCGESAAATVRKPKPGLPAFHNSGHMTKERRDLAFFNTHAEVEKKEPRCMKAG